MTTDTEIDAAMDELGILMLSAYDIVDRMRDRGWLVAVHNDYWLNGKLMTFWLFTHEAGFYVKGEGETDGEALRECYRQAGYKLPLDQKVP